MAAQATSEAKLIAKERKKLMALMDKGTHKLPKRKVDENVLIASWNIAHFSNNKTKRAVQYIADICERFDIVAIQEAKTDLRGLERLQELLPGDYRLIVSDPTGNSERFAFLYDTRTVQSTGLVCEIAFHAKLPTSQAFTFNRTPYCASFRAGRFDFTMVSVHIAEASSFGKQGKQLRKQEIQELEAFIKDRAGKGKGKVFDPDFFVVGDFNIQQEGDEFFEALAGGSKPHFEMHPNIKTNFSRTKTFDKIAWLPSKSFEFTGRFGVIPFGNVLYKEPGAPANEARKRVSDHLPLWVEVRVKSLEHQLDQIINKNH